jgi:hypothetical protein
MVGLSSAKAAIASLVQGKSGVHAVLLYGAEGCGKTVLANLLANAWLCKKPGEAGACGECQACQSFGRGTCADFQRIEPQPPSRLIRRLAIYDNGKPEPAPSIPTVPVQTFFRTPPLMAAHKVVVIEDADRLLPDAANALLKTLEEPQPHGKLILTTTAVGLVLPTILSRCVALACEVPSEEELRQAFGQLSQPEVLLSGGSIGVIEQMRQRPESYQRLYDFAASLPNRPASHALAAADEFREICESLEASSGTARAANAEGLKLLATALSGLGHAEMAALVVETHRRIQGNAGASPALDALLAGLLVRQG